MQAIVEAQARRQRERADAAAAEEASRRAGAAAAAGGEAAAGHAPECDRSMSDVAASIEGLAELFGVAEEEAAAAAPLPAAAPAPPRSASGALAAAAARPGPLVRAATASSLGAGPTACTSSGQTLAVLPSGPFGGGQVGSGGGGGGGTARRLQHGAGRTPITRVRQDGCGKDDLRAFLKARGAGGWGGGVGGARGAVGARRSARCASWSQRACDACCADVTLSPTPLPVYRSDAQRAKRSMRLKRLTKISTTGSPRRWVGGWAGWGWRF